MSFELTGVGWDMAAIFSTTRDVLTKLTPGGAPGLAQLTDDELLANTRRLVGKSNQLLAALLVHLAEVEARGVHRTRRCASLYTYCIYELRFSEDEAARRSAAARWVKQFPALFEAIADGELHLTGLLMIGPHLTPDNHLEVLGRAKFRTKKELGELVRELNPLPRVPDCIEPLGPSLPRTPRAPTWAEFAASLCPPVRELPAGERPRAWANDGFESVNGGEAPRAGGDAIGAGDETLPEDSEALPVGPVPADLPPVTGPQHYQVQFSTVEEHVQLIERARALLARERPGATLGELHLEAMKMFVAALEKRKFAVIERPRKRNSKPAKLDQRQPSEAPRQRGAAVVDRPEPAEAPRQRVALDRPEPSGAPRQRVSRNARQPSETPRWHARYIPAAERREVYRRDCGRCTYADARGERCCETRYLEMHHLRPFARQGAHVASNLALRCRAHNQLAAEQDFGAELMAKRRNSLRHESLGAQVNANANANAESAETASCGVRADARTASLAEVSLSTRAWIRSSN
jgi:5-methylcytosine-specific restriction endonuclease McrA